MSVNRKKNSLNSIGHEITVNMEKQSNGKLKKSLILRLKHLVGFKDNVR